MLQFRGMLRFPRCLRQAKPGRERRGLDREKGDRVALWKKKEPEPVVPVYEPARERTLCAGAILADWSGCATHTLVITEQKQAARMQKQTTRTLASAWDVRTAEQLRSTVGRLLTGGQHVEIDPFFVSLREVTLGDPTEEAPYALFRRYGSSLDDLHSVYRAIRKKLQNPDGTKMSDTDLYTAVTTTRAWDLERAAWVARMGVMAGLVDEQETFAILQAAREQIEQTYRSWRDYGIAFAAGRAIGFGNNSFLVVGTLVDQLNDPSSLLNRYPIGS